MAETEILKWSRRLSLRRPAREMLIFSKWLYRNKNHQRRDKAYQKLNRVKKDFKKYYNQELYVHTIQTVKQALSSSESGYSDPSSNKVLLKSLLDRLSSCIVYVGRYLEFMESTFNDLMERIHIGHNIPMYTMILASLSRIWFYMRLHIWSLVETYLHISELLPLPHPKDHLYTIISKDHQRYLPAYMRTNQKPLSEIQDESTNAKVEMGPEMMENRQKDFETPSLYHTPQAPPVNCKKNKQCFKRLPSVFKIAMCKHGRNRLFYLHSKKIAGILQDFRHRRQSGYKVVLCIAYIRATRSYLPFGNQVKRIRLKLRMKKYVKHNRHRYRRKKLQSRNASPPPAGGHKSHDNHVTTSNSPNGMLFDKCLSDVSKNNQTIDDIFSSIDY